VLVVRLGGRKEFSSRNPRIVLRFVLQTDREDLAVKSHRTANRSVLKELAEREGSSSALTCKSQWTLHLRHNTLCLRGYKRGRSSSTVHVDDMNALARSSACPMSLWRKYGGKHNISVTNLGYLAEKSCCSDVDRSVLVPHN